MLCVPDVPFILTATHIQRLPLLQLLQRCGRGALPLLSSGSGLLLKAAPQTERITGSLYCLAATLSTSKAFAPLCLWRDGRGHPSASVLGFDTVAN